MLIDLNQLKQNDISDFVNSYKKTDKGLASVESNLQDFSQYFYERARCSETDKHQLVLTRVFLVLNFTQLDQTLQQHLKTIERRFPNFKTMNYLVLMGTYGAEDRWCDRTQSLGHKAIPLTAETVPTIPMVSRCLQQIGLDLEIVVAGDRDRGLVLEGMRKLYGVFHVPDAEGSPFIPAQDDFVKPYGVRSVLGSGTCLPVGIPMISISFCTMDVSAKSAGRFAPLATEFSRCLQESFRQEVFFEKSLKEGESH